MTSSGLKMLSDIGVGVAPACGARASRHNGCGILMINYFLPYLYTQWLCCRRPFSLWNSKSSHLQTSITSALLFDDSGICKPLHEYMEPPCLGLFTREKFVGGASSRIGHQRAKNMCAHLEYRVQKELEQIEKAAKVAKVKLRRNYRGTCLGVSTRLNYSSSSYNVIYSRSFREHETNFIVTQMETERMANNN